MDRTEWPTWAEYNEEDLNSLYVKLRRKLFDIRFAKELAKSSEEMEELSNRAQSIHAELLKIQRHAFNNGIKIETKIGNRNDKGRKIK